ncbi:MAG: type II toxin-antitoxin system RelE/ParE family toxin [Candidatus Kapabacteria bacterium]|nr:type II toxin-antitoxin system RelE/ParE family toxin [Candidatus Kapabacteria bacterium]
MKDEIFMKKEFTYEFAEINGKNEMLIFLKSLDKRESAKVFANIYKLLEILNLGIRPKESLSKYVQDGIFELKVSLKNKISRSFYFYESNGILIFTHGFIKKTTKLPQNEINKAIKIKELYLGVKK